MTTHSLFSIAVQFALTLLRSTGFSKAATATDGSPIVAYT